MAFTRDWDESQPTDKTNAVDIDDYNRYLRVDCSDRLKNMVYGFIAGENTLAQHFQYLQFYEQSSAPSTPAAGYGRVYCKAVGGKCELFWKDEDGDEIQLTTGGKWNGAVLLAGSVPAGSYAANSVDEDDIQLANDAYLTALDNAGTGTVDLIKAGTNDLPTLPDSSEMASNAAPVEDEAIANKKYVDDQNASDHPAYSGGESHTDGSGLIIKTGYQAIGATSGTITFATAFPNDVIGLGTTLKYSGATTNTVTITDFTTADIDWAIGDAGMTGFWWIAIGY